MRKEAAQYLHEARVALDDARTRFTMINSMTAVGAGAVFGSAELGVKTVIAEKYGSVPRKYRTHDIVGLAQQTGLWDELPTVLRDYLSEIAPFDPDIRYAGSAAYQRLVSASSPEQWERLLARNDEMLDFIEGRVLGDPAVLWRLTR